MAASAPEPSAARPATPRVGGQPRAPGACRRRRGVPAARAPRVRAAPRDVWTGIKRTLGAASAFKEPAVTADLRELAAVLSTVTLRGMHYRALILIGFAGCFRHSAIARLTIRNVMANSEGLMLTLASSKTGKHGAGSVERTSVTARDAARAREPRLGGALRPGALGW